MVDPVGIATTVVGLLPLCKDGFCAVRDIFQASSAAQEAGWRVHSQMSVYDTWRKIWDSSEGPSKKFEEYAKENPKEAKAVQHELALLSYTMFNVEKLLKKYGFRRKEKELKLKSLPNPATHKLTKFKPLAEYLQNCKHNLSLIKKCTFVMTSADKEADILIDRLKERIEVLKNYNPKQSMPVFLGHLFEEFVRQCTSSPALCDILIKEGERSRKKGQKSLPYDNMGIACKFSNDIKKKGSEPRTFEISEFTIKSTYKVDASQAADMVLMESCPPSKQRRVVYVEWMSNYSPDANKRASAKASMLGIAKPGQLLLPYCYGVVEDSKNNRIGLVLAPPDHIRKELPQVMVRGSISHRRKPKSLQGILEKALGDQKEDLGIRFALAKKLVIAIHMMHSVGWIHKNIRSGSIILFPKKSWVQAAQIDGIPVRLDWNQPFFVGFGHARLQHPNNNPRNPGLSIRPKEITLDTYHHPKKLQDPKIEYRRSFDVYSLGCVLLESGVWRPLSKLVRRSDETRPDKIRECLQGHVQSLKGLTGSIYAEAVEKCLSVDSLGSSKEDDSACSKLLLELIGELDKCTA